MPPLSHGLGRPQRGEKESVPQIGPNPGSGTALAAQPKFSNTKKTLGRQGILGNVENLVATKTPRNLNNTGENKVFCSKADPTWRPKSQKNLIKPMGNGVFCQKERQAHGHPLASPRRGKKWVPPGGHGQAWLRPASAGKKNGFPKSGDPFFFPAP